jgi:hypothetical protein
MSDEWYPRECEFCTWEAALACQDPACRDAGHGQPHILGCPALETRQVQDCSCVRSARLER